ncbi:MAG: sulfatase-like hydrolase/transferase [Armatimonadota bacterium]|nr:MAG: sulfatase-like hydrolase/transferase [Armatimonadota bacterium]
MRAHLRVAATVGMFIGMAVGVSEALAPAVAHQRSPAADGLWPLWALTVGIYSALGAAALIPAGVLGGIIALLRPLSPAKVWRLYSAVGAGALTAYFMTARAELDLPADVLALFAAKVVLVSSAVGAFVSLAAVLAARRRVSGAPAAAGLAAGYLLGGALWMRGAANGTSAGEKIGAVTAGAAAFAAIWLIWRKCAGTRVAPTQHRSWARVWTFWPVAFLLVIGLAGIRIAFPAPSPGASNVLLVIVDALRADRLGCYGSVQGLTPELDRFARDAVLFENALAPAPWTVPSMGSMLASRFPSEVGAGRPMVRTSRPSREGGVLTPDPTLPELLRRAGYMTRAELTNGHLRRDRGFASGFVSFRCAPDAAGQRAPALPRLGRYEAWFVRTSLGRAVARALHDPPRYSGGGERDIVRARRVINDTCAWLSRQGHQPFFLWIHLMDVHAPYDPPQKSPATLAAFPHPPFHSTLEFYVKLRSDMRSGRAKLTPDDKGYMEALYDDGVRYADRWLGRLLKHLRESGMYDNTLIIISADHGEEFWDHGGWEHGHSMYDELLHVPLLIKFPHGHHAGKRVSRLVGLIDLMPTVLDVVGLPIPRGVRGQTLLENLSNGPASRDGREMYAESALRGEELKALRTPEHKVIFHTESRAVEVYDLRADPGERRNLAGDPAAAAESRERLIALARDSARSIAWWARYPQEPRALSPSVLRHLRAIGYVAD